MMHWIGGLAFALFVAGVVWVISKFTDRRVPPGCCPECRKHLRPDEFHMCKDCQESRW